MEVELTKNFAATEGPGVTKLAAVLAKPAIERHSGTDRHAGL